MRTKKYVRFTGKIEKAGLEVLEDLEDAPLSNRRARKITACVIKSTWRYLVRYFCCGAEGSISHDQIHRRIQDGVTQCKACADKTAQETRKKGKSDKTFSRREGAPKGNMGVINRWAQSFLTAPAWAPPPSAIDPKRNESEKKH